MRNTVRFIVCNVEESYLKVQIKPSKPLRDISDFLSTVRTGLKTNNDGLIFTPSYGGLERQNSRRNGRPILKWKPSHTLDFGIDKDFNLCARDNGALISLSTARLKYSAHTLPFRYKDEDAVLVLRECDKNDYLLDDRYSGVIECSLVESDIVLKEITNKGEADLLYILPFAVRRIRQDKKIPNSKFTIENT